jgi:hypothetical protein
MEEDKCVYPECSEKAMRKCSYCREHFKLIYGDADWE